jgi:ketosteroid isomerase-like protein
MKLNLETDIQLRNMKMIRVILIIALTGALNIELKSQGITKNLDDCRRELEALNSRIEQLYLTEDVNALTSLYASQFTFFPEYKPAIFEIKALNKFFKDWFTAGDVRIYKKKLSAVEVYSDHLLELGTFSFHYSSIKNPQGEYKGNYMVLWKSDNDGKLSIISETFGANTYIEPEVVPYTDVHVEETNFSAIDNVNRKLIDEIEEFDAVVLKAVANGDGKARADGFTKDAILLSSFDSILVGMENIRPKMLKTYTPNTSYVVKHYYNTMYDFGDYVFVTGQYKGGWGDSTKGGRFEGNMSNLLKRTKNGKLLMHRQAGNRDRKLVLFNN